MKKPSHIELLVFFILQIAMLIMPWGAWGLGFGKPDVSAFFVISLFWFIMNHLIIIDIKDKN